MSGDTTWAGRVPGPGGGGSRPFDHGVWGNLKAPLSHCDGTFVPVSP
jgi:hypothetical protein